MQNKVSTIILTGNTQTRKVLELYLSEFEHFEVLDMFADYTEIYDTLAMFDKSVLIVDVSDNFDSKLDFISNVSQNIHNCKIAVLSDNPSVDLIVRVMRAGAREFLPLPLIKTEFIEALSRINESLYCAPKKNTKCKIISVFSNKGGIGKTSIASNLALELAKITKENVALLDLNFQLGDITTFMDLKPSFNISYMLENLDKMNDDFLLSTMEKYKSTSLYVLADPPFFKQAADILPEHITKLFSMLKKTFSYIVVDAESSFDAKNIAALTESDLIFLVTIANLPALRNAQRCLELFERLGFDKNKTQILLNRYMENDEVSIDDIENVLERKVYWKIPNNYFTMMSSINKGIPVSDINPDSNVAKSYRDLALHLTDSIYRTNLIKRYENIIN